MSEFPLVLSLSKDVASVFLVTFVTFVVDVGVVSRAELARCTAHAIIDP
jgi:hypothetical protein